MENIELTKTDCQLLLYDIFKGSQQIAFEDITSRLPIDKKMIQRDMKDLAAAGLIRVKLGNLCAMLMKYMMCFKNFGKWTTHICLCNAILYDRIRLKKVTGGRK